MSGEALIKWGLTALAAALLVGLVAVFVITAEAGMRDRECFEVGGRIANGVCMPVDGAVNFKGGERG